MRTRPGETERVGAGELLQSTRMVARVEGRGQPAAIAVSAARFEPRRSMTSPATATGTPARFSKRSMPGAANRAVAESEMARRSRPLGLRSDNVDLLTGAKGET